MAIEPIYLLAAGPLPAELIEEAAAKGIVLDTVSLIATGQIDDEEMGARIKALGDRQLTAIFTSTNAVEAVKVWMNARVDWRIFCIGGATGRAVADYFGVAAIGGTADSATALADLVIAEAHQDAGSAWETKEIFFFCGDQRREELPVMLRAEGFKVNEWIVYRTLLTPQKTEGVYAGIAFFSPRAVESYFSLNPVAEDGKVFAIGRTTAAAIQARCSLPVIIRDRPGKEALVRTMTDYFQTNNKE